MKTNRTLENIELYLEGQLSGDELTEFKEAQDTDPEFAKMTEDYKLAMRSVEEFGKQELKKQLRQIHIEEIKASPKFGQRELFRYAAIFIGFLIVSAPFLYTYFTSNPNYQKLYDNNFSLYPDIISQRGETQNLMLEEAMSYYKNKDFENAAVLFHNLDVQELPFAKAIKLYSGISYLGSGDNILAEDVFVGIINDNDNPFDGQAKWYLALSYLSRENIDEAVPLLDEIVGNKSYNHARAKKILKEF